MCIFYYICSKKLEIYVWIKYDKYTCCHEIVKKLNEYPKLRQIMTNECFYMNMCS